MVRPYTYAHHNPQQNYAHYNQPLAHPLGANFSEFLVMANYKYKRWQLDGKLIFAKYGAKVMVMKHLTEMIYMSQQVLLKSLVESI